MVPALGEVGAKARPSWERRRSESGKQEPLVGRQTAEGICTHLPRHRGVVGIVVIGGVDN